MPALLLAGCSNGSPVSVRDCSLSAVNQRQIGLIASFSPYAGKAVRSVTVIIDVSNASNAYQFDGALSPKSLITRRSIALVAQNSYDLHEHLGPVSCYVDGVTFSDGTTWFGGTPDM
jgi:hypothetical protein